VVSHLSSASFKEWDEFKKLSGRNWVMGASGHGPRSVFKCNIADPEHPITKGLAGFETDDELYAKLQGDTPIKVLVTADSDWSKKTEPLVFVLEYGQGRVFHHTFGQGGIAYLPRFSWISLMTSAALLSAPIETREPTTSCGIVPLFPMITALVW
jgi:type 1 glutamine amidotransferase